MKKNLFLFVLLQFCAALSAQNFTKFSVQNAHSHNDYKQSVPFWGAYYAGFGSIEADVFYKNNQFFVAHEEPEILPENTLESLYLKPVSSMIKKNGNHIYPDASKKLILFIELKSPYQTSLKPLAEILRKYPEITTNPGIKIIITGHIPEPSGFKNYPDFLFFDGDLTKSYTENELKRVGMFSGNLESFTNWHGKGIMRDEEKKKVTAAVTKAHQMKKPVRFWGAPDFPNAWINLIDAGVDYVNTDHIPQLTDFLNQLPKSFYKNEINFQSYQPTYISDGIAKKVKNVILLIPDGVSLPQYYAAFTASRGSLNIFKMKSTGLSKTNSANAYITDSAPGSTAFATGVKTKNNFVGVDSAGVSLKQIPDLIAARGFSSGLMTTGDITDATPADFYAHTDNRDNSTKILEDFVASKVSVLAGSAPDKMDANAETNFAKKGIALFNSTENANFNAKRLIITDPRASKNYAERGRWLGETFDKTIKKLQNDGKGFFLMVEGSRTDINAHANDFGKVVQELLDFDEVVGKAMQFADINGETLVIVVGDHETGGLSILDGSLKDGWVLGNYSTNDHTAIPASVFAYGPNSNLFTGFYENTEVFKKIMQSFGF